MADFYVIITDAGQALLAAALAGGAPVELSQFAVGDGNGAAVTPNPAQTALLHELYRGNISSLHAEGNQIAAQAVIPKDSGGYTIREVGLYTSTGVLFSVGNYPNQYKPVPGTGYAVKLDIRYLLQVEDTDCITLVVTGDDYLTREEADTIYLQIGNNLSEIAGNGTAAQKAARDNLALGTAATHDVTTSHTDTTDGRVLQVGDFGVGGFAITTPEVENFSYDNIPVNLPTGFYTHLIEDIEPDGVYCQTVTLRQELNHTGAGYVNRHIILPAGDKPLGLRYDYKDNAGAYHFTYVFMVDEDRQINGHPLSSNITVNSQDIYKTAKSLTTEDLNTLQIAGLYYQSANVNATSARHYPSTNAGSLQVYISAGITQVYIEYASANGSKPRTFQRGCYNGAWSAWKSDEIGTFVQDIRWTGETQTTSVAPPGAAVTHVDAGENMEFIRYRYLQYEINGAWKNSGAVSVQGLKKESEVLFNPVPETLRVATEFQPYASSNSVYQGLITEYVSAEGFDWQGAMMIINGQYFIKYSPDTGVINQIETDPTLICPENLSIAGIEVLPDGACIDGTWVFDGETVYQDAELLAGYNRRRNSPTYQQLLSSAALEQQQLVTTALLAQSGAGDPLTPAEVNYLSALQAYISALKSVNLEISAPDWPSVPVAP